MSLQEVLQGVIGRLYWVVLEDRCEGRSGRVGLQFSEVQLCVSRHLAIMSFLYRF